MHVVRAGDELEALDLRFVQQSQEVLVIGEVDVEEGLAQSVALDHQLPEGRGVGIAGLEEGVDLGLDGGRLRP